MSSSEILALYDAQMRCTQQPPDMRREECGEVVRLIDVQGIEGTILYSRLQEADVRKVAEREIQYFRKLAQDFEWKVFAHDHPSDLIQRLQAIGFSIEQQEALMLLDLQAAPALLDFNSSHEIRRITTADAMNDVVAVQNKVWKEDHRWIAKRLSHWLKTQPDYVAVYVAYSDGQPVSCGWINFPNETDFAGIWGGCTLPEFRRDGFYTALVAARLREARARGFRFVTVDAQPPSRPILEKRGFQIIGWSQEAKWRHGKGTRENRSNAPS